MVKIFVVTVSDGNQSELLKTINSVKKQEYKNLKHIIIVKKISNQFVKKNKNKKNLFIIGKDNSIYSAMNIGEHKSYKNYTLYLNSGDLFYSKSSLRKISNLIAKYKNYNLQLVSVLKFSNLIFFPKKKFFFKKNTFTHSSFIRAPIKKKNLISFSLEHPITADGIWMKAQIKLKKLYVPITIFHLGGISSAPSIKTLLIKKKDGLCVFFKELIKFFLIKFLPKKFYYRLIYIFKYELK